MKRITFKITDPIGRQEIFRDNVSFRRIRVSKLGYQNTGNHSWLFVDIPGLNTHYSVTDVRHDKYMFGMPLPKNCADVLYVRDLSTWDWDSALPHEHTHMDFRITVNDGKEAAPISPTEPLWLELEYEE